MMSWSLLLLILILNHYQKNPQAFTCFPPSSVKIFDYKVKVLHSKCVNIEVYYQQNAPFY